MKELVFLNETEKEVAGQTAMEIDGKHFQVGNFFVPLGLIDDNPVMDIQSQLEHLRTMRRIISEAGTGKIKGMKCALIDGTSESAEDKTHRNLDGMEMIEADEAVKLIDEVIENIREVRNEIDGVPQA